MSDTPLSSEFAVEPILKRDRAVFLTFVSGIAAVAWIYTLGGVGMERSPFEMTLKAGQLGVLVAKPVVWSLPDAAAVFARWWMMMVAIMVPVSAPLILQYAGVRRTKHPHSNAYVSTALFVVGFMVLWAAFSLAATAVQWWLEQGAYMSAAMSIVDKKLAGGVLIAVGLYQFTGVKQRCLKLFRNPLHHLTSNWRDGSLGALGVGWAHGAISLGNCWCLMALLVVGGVMNVFWIVGLAAYLLLEKFSRYGSLLSIAFGCAITCWGMFVLGSALRP